MCVYAVCAMCACMLCARACVFGYGMCVCVCVYGTCVCVCFCKVWGFGGGDKTACGMKDPCRLYVYLLVMSICVFVSGFACGL